MTEDELVALGRSPVDRVADALVAGDRPAAMALAAKAERGWQRSVDGFRVWIVHTLAFLTDAHGAEAAGIALGVLTDAMAARSPWAESALPPATASDEVLDALRETERARRAEHDWWLDAVCVVLSHVYRTHGIETLDASMRFAGGRTLLAWMPIDIKRAPEERVRTWVSMLQGNFASVTVSEDDEKFTITQDPCGSCGRQIAAGAFPGPLGLAVVDEIHPITFERGETPIYRTHVAVMHFLVPEERFGVPWPVVACPRGMAAGPCHISLYKNPHDPAARRAADALRGSGHA